MTDFYRSQTVKASRKRRICDECGHPIEIGESYRYAAYRYEGEFETQQAHPECQAWANQVMCCDDGRAFLRDSDPADEDGDELDESIRQNPPSGALYRRLPTRWRAAVDRALGADSSAMPAAVTDPGSTKNQPFLAQQETDSGL